MSKPNITEASTSPKKSRRTVAADASSKRAASGEAARSARQLQLVQEINQILASDARIEQAIQQALRLILGELAYGAAQIYRLSPFGKDLWLYLDVTAHDDIVSGQSGTIFSIEEDNLLCQAVREQKPVYLPNVRQDSQSYPVRVETQGDKTDVPRLRVASELALPMAFGAKLVGALRVQSERSADFETEDTNFFTTVASLLGMKVELSQMVQQLQDELQEMQILYKLQREEEQKTRRPDATRGVTPGYEYHEGQINTLENLPGPARQALSQDQFGVSALQDTEHKELIAPLTLYNEPIGILGVENAITGEDWTTEDITLLEEVSSQIALAIENSRLLRQAQERSRQLSVLFETSRQLSETINLQQIYDIVTSQVIDYLHADLCSVWLLNRTATELELIAAKGRDETSHVVELSGPLRQVLAVENSTALLQLTRQPEPVVEQFEKGQDPGGIVPWLAGQPDHLRPALAGRLRTLVRLPLLVRNKLVGILDAGVLDQPRDYTPTELQLAQTITARATVAVENAQLFEQTELALAETQKLYQISRSLVESSTMDDIFRVVLDNIKTFNIDRVSISLLEWNQVGEIDGVTIVANWDRETEGILPVGTKLSADTFTLVRAFARPPFFPLISENLRQAEGQDERMDDAFRLFMHQGLGAETLFSAPMFLGAEYKGVLSISTRTPHHYEEQEIRIYQTLADQSIIAIERQRLLEVTRQERDRASLLYELGQVLSRTGSIDEVKKAILKFSRKLNVSQCEIYVTDGGDFLSMASTVSGRQRRFSRAGASAVLAQGVVAQALSQGQHILAAGLEEFGSWPELAGQQVAAIPFYSQRSSLRGVLNFFKPEQAAFGSDQISTLESIVTQTSVALENVWLLEQTAVALHETELLYQATREFSSARHVEELLPILVASLESANVGHVSIALLPPAGRMWEPEELNTLSRWDGQAADVSYPVTSLRAEDYPFIEQLDSTTPYQVHYNQLDREVQARVDEYFGPNCSLLCVPLTVGTNWLGVLFRADDSPDTLFRAGITNQVLALAGQAAVVMQNLQLVEETQQNLFHSEILSHLSQELLLADTTEGIYNLCLEAIAATEPERGAAIFIYDQSEGGVELEMVALWNNPGQDWPDVPVGARFSTEDLGLGPLLRTGQTVTSLNALADERFSPMLQQLLLMMQISSLVAIPVWLNKEVNGFILAGHYTARAFSEETIRLYEDLARQVSGALENRRLFVEAQYRATLLQTAAEVSQAATGSLELDTLLPRSVDLIRNRFGYYHVSIFLVDEYRRYAVIQASTGEIGQQMLAMRHKLEVGGKSIVGTATGTGKPRIALDVGTDAIHFNNPLLPGTRSEMALPLIARGQVIGALDVQSEKPGAFSESDITILQSMANQLANAIEAAQAFQQSRQSLEEVSKLHEYYLREQWDTFLAEQATATGYCLTETGLVQPEAENKNQELVREAIKTKQPVILPLSTGTNGLGGGAAPADSQAGPDQPQGAAKIIAPLSLHDGLVLGAVDFEIRDESKLWAEDDLRIVEAVTSQAAQAIEAARLFEQTQVAREEAEALYEVGRSLVASENLPDMYHTVLRAMLSTLGLNQGGILFFDEDRKSGVLHALFEDSRPVEAGLRFPVEGNLSYDRLIQTKRPVTIEDVANDPLVATVRDINLERGIASLLLVPIIVNDEVIGAMGADALGQKHIFTEREINLASAMADQLSLMLQNRQLLEETRRRAVQLQTSADVSRATTSILDQDLMLGQAVELIKERFGFYHVQIFLVDEAGQYAVLHKSTGEAGQKLLAMKHKLAVGSQSVIGQVTFNRRPSVVRDIDAARAGAPEARNEFLPDTRAELAVPLQVGEQLIGALDVQSTSPDAFSKDDIATLETLAAHLAVAIQNARAFREQQETAERLKEIDKLKTQFLANMSHELRTPLNSIIGFSRVILKGIDGPLTELQKTDLTSIHNSGQHLLGLINNILDLSKIEAGKMELNFEEVEIEPIVKGVMSTAIALVKDKEVNLLQKVPDNLPRIWADPTRLRQVILNLVSNACKFTEHGTITVQVRADDERMLISVSDTGIGIPEDQLESIFEEFTQVDASTTRKVGGTGLGLPISRHFVDMHKGRIWGESTPGRGSTFFISLPLKPSAEKDEVEGPAQEEQPGPHDKKLILAIDDDPGVLTLYRRFLEKQDYHIVGVTHSRNVVAQAKEHAPVAILLDVLIPEKDGWNVIRELKADPLTRDIPVIICSIVSDKNRGFSLGAADYLIKPIVEDDLVKALHSLEDRQKEQIKVLVVDDQAEDILLIRRFLEAQSNYNIIEASNGKEGLELVKTREPDLIILDLSMPEMDGFSMVEALKGDDKTRIIPIIIVSARELKSAELELLNGRVEALLRKGLFTENELLEDVSRALEFITKKETPTT